ncbi:MAG: hypothetical protein AAGG68_09745 [Bacteroidota bacterium]
MAGAGFQQAASSSLRNNRNLRRGSGSYFNNRNAKTHRYVVRKQTTSAKKLSPISVVKEKRFSQKNVFKVLLIASIISMIFYGIIQLAFFISDLEYRSFITSNVGDNLIERSEKLKQYDYHAWVRIGDHYLSQHQLDQAQNAYVHALHFFPNGKEANIGMSQVLDAKCQELGEYCEEAMAYKENLIENEIAHDLQKIRPTR